MVGGRRLSVALSLALVLGVVACSEDDPSGPDGDDVTTIEMQSGNTFSPATRTVEVGTIVRWVNEDQVAHNTTSTTGEWESNDLNPDGTFQHTFSTAGTFPYECTIHPGMTGTITVQ